MCLDAIHNSRHANPQLDKGFVIGVNLNISAYDRIDIVLSSNAKIFFCES